MYINGNKLVVIYNSSVIQLNKGGVTFNEILG